MNTNTNIPDVKGEEDHHLLAVELASLPFYSDSLFNDLCVSYDAEDNKNSKRVRGAKNDKYAILRFIRNNEALLRLVNNHENLVKGTKESVKDIIDTGENNSPRKSKFNKRSEADNLLSELFGGDDVTMKKEITSLFTIPEVRELYVKEYEKRKDNIGILLKGMMGLPQLRVLDSEIEKLEKGILAYKLKCHRENKTPVNLNLRKIRNKIEGLEALKNEILSSRETATAYEFENIMKYRKQFKNTGFIMTPSRQKIVDELIEKMIIGENVLLAGSTGGGKTVLAGKLIEIMSDLENRVVMIDSEKLRQDIEQDKTFKEYLISGNSSLRVSDFIGKLVLDEGEKGGTKTRFELGKLLKAWENGKIPVFDEIDLAPNDILMRVKHLFTKRPGDTYSPQEDGDTEVILKTTGTVATANIKGEKHSEREELDNAILRLFHMINISQIPEDEMVEMTKAMLADESGSIKGVGAEELKYGEEEWQNEHKASILYLLIKAIRQIQDNYLSKDSIANASGSKKNLKKAIFEMGNFVSFIRGYSFIAGSKIYGNMDFNSYIKRRVIEFITRPGYPKDDRIILLKIFSLKGLVTKTDIPLLLERMEDISETELESEINDANINFVKSEVPFIDPYELANIDPYKKRKLEERELSNKTRLTKDTLQNILQGLIKIRPEASQNGLDDIFEKCRDIVGNSIDKLATDENYEVGREQWEEIIALLYDLGNTELLLSLRLSRIKDISEIITDLIELYDKSENGKKLFGELPTVSPINIADPIRNSSEGAPTILIGKLHEQIDNQSKSILKRLHESGNVSVEGGEIPSNLTSEEIAEAEKVKKTRNVTTSGARDIVLDKLGYNETIKIIDLKIDGINFIAMQVPQSLKGKKMRETQLGKRLIDKESNNWFVGGNFLDEKITKDFIIISKENFKDASRNTVRSIATSDSSKPTDVIRESSKRLFRGAQLEESIILGEIIASGMGQDYIDFDGYKADGDEAGNEDIRAKIQQIESFTGMKFEDYNSNNYITRNWGAYVDKEGKTRAFLRCYYSGHGAQGGVCSLSLACGPDGANDNVGFRLSL